MAEPMDTGTVSKLEATSQRSIRVLFVIPLGSSKHSMIFARRQVSSLQHAGIICETFFLRSRTNLRVLFREWAELRKMIRDFQPDIVHGQYGTMTGFLSAMSTRIPVVVTFRGSDLLKAPGEAWMRAWIGRLLSQAAAFLASQVICVSEGVRDLLWIKHSKASVIPSGVDTTAFYPRLRDEARCEIGWSSEYRIVLFNAGPDPRLKRLDLAEKALAVAKRACPDIQLAVLNGDVAPEKIPSMMCAADCLLLTSDTEGSPNVVKEAMACNLPVVSVDVGDVRFRLERVQPSHIVDRDPEQLGKAIGEVLLLNERSNGSASIHDLSSSAVAERIISVYRRTLGDLAPCSRGWAAQEPRKA
jgi:teichuronic acid biosynthesis glycosyltransferase TuaC